MKKLLLLLLLSLGLIGISYAGDSQEAVEREIAEFEAQLEVELARQRLLLLEALAQHYKDGTIVDIMPTDSPFYLKYVYVKNIRDRVRSYWNYQGAEVGWGCQVYVLQDRDGTIEAVNIKNCSTGNSDNALMADDKARSFKNSIERAVYKASPLPIATDEGVFRRELMFYFRAI